MSDGFALRLDRSGAVLERVMDGLGLAEGDTLEVLVAPSARAKAGRFLDAVGAEGATTGWEVLMRTTSGVTLVQLSGCASDGAVVVFGHPASRDMRGPAQPLDALDELTRLTNDLGALQRDLAKKNRALTRLDRRKNQLLGMVAHDLRTPIGLVAAFSRLLSRRADGLSEADHKILTRIEANSRFMLELVEDLLDLSAVESGEVRLDRVELSVADWVTDAVELVSPMAEAKDTHVVRDLPDGLVVWADRRRVQQVLTNFLTNAVKYGPPQAHVTVRAIEDEGTVRVEVIDQGPGIPADERARLFQPFATTSVRSTGGEKSTGLGLAIAKKVIDAHGGEIGVDSVVGEGTTFWCRLPTRAAPGP